MERRHATCVAINRKGILIMGPSGSGKSDLALRLIERGADLVADDQVELTAEKGDLIARSPQTIKGLIEARYIGPLRAPVLDACPIAVILEPGTPERMPELQTRTFLGIELPMLILPYLEGSTTAKIRLFLEQ